MIEWFRDIAVPNDHRILTKRPFRLLRAAQGGCMLAPPYQRF